MKVQRPGGRSATVRRQSHAGRKARAVRRRMDDARGTPRRPTPRQYAYLLGLRRLGRQATAVELAEVMAVGQHACREMLRGLIASGWVARLPGRPMPLQLTLLGSVVLVARAAETFGEAMRSQGIHVGIGTPPVCVVCAVPYPCAAADANVAACLRDAVLAAT